MHLTRSMRAPVCWFGCTRSLALLERAQSEVVADGVAKLVAAALRNTWGHSSVSRLVLLGLGSPTSSAPARYQLALALTLVTTLDVASECMTHAVHTPRPRCRRSRVKSRCAVLFDRLAIGL
jgi:hypothetical protein